MARKVLNGLAVEGPATVTGKTDEVQLVVKGNATQTANSTDWRDSTGAPLLSVRSDGALVFGGDTTFFRLVAGAFYTTAAIISAANLISESDARVDGTLYFGSAFDTNLFRLSANILKTEDLFDASTAGVRTKHESGATPTGGTSGEVRVGTDKIWVQDAGTWKSAAVSAAGAPSFASMAKWGTD